MRSFAFLVLLAACGPAMMPPPPPPATTEPMPEFALTDVNPASATSGQQVGPSRYRGKVSGWYFTHTT